MNLGEVLHVFNRFFELAHSVDPHRKHGVERDLAIHVRLAMKEARVSLLVLR